ncbi:phosphoglycolate phosphatase [Allopusillimonas ginsengisoli]|uniref:phosphoglycolate phosphatase n=1 Tax=Allopusillimonas ginsengisoli TaxID=453575 RepID=UPI00101E87D3|nr:phosphoglycolate phosphatase [Allopusillimonas ginsengisoli]TEA77808.1 phosphoglycolate phosphatase [Allopusillimonas ginsengisoli]
MTFDAVLLDLDGTLIDTIPDLADAANAMRADLGLPALPQDVIATYVGKGTSVLVERALANNVEGSTPGAQEIEQGLALFHRHYHHFNGRRAALYPGVLEGLQAFRSAGMKLSIVTNKPTAFTPPLLAQCGLSSFFDAIVCGDTCVRKKPDPMPLLHACSLLGVAPGTALAVGDSINDAQAARAAGITVLAVPYGYNEGMDVRNLDVDDIVASIAEAAQWAAGQSLQIQNT